MDQSVTTIIWNHSLGTRNIHHHLLVVERSWCYMCAHWPWCHQHHLFWIIQATVSSEFTFGRSVWLFGAASSPLCAVFLTEHSHWAPSRASWWLDTPVCVHPSMQSGRCGHSSGQTCTGHSGADWPGDGNSCGTLEWQNWEGNKTRKHCFFYWHHKTIAVRGAVEDFKIEN